MLNKTLYPKTKRVKLENKVVITEKLDGSNNHAIYVKEAYGHPIKNGIYAKDVIRVWKEVLIKSDYKTSKRKYELLHRIGN